MIIMVVVFSAWLNCCRRRRRRRALKGKQWGRARGSRRLLDTWWRARLCKLNPEINRCRCHHPRPHCHYHHYHHCHRQMAGRCDWVRLRGCAKIGRSFPGSPSRSRRERGGSGESGEDDDDRDDDCQVLRTKLTANSSFDKQEEHFLVWKHQVLKHRKNCETALIQGIPSIPGISSISGLLEIDIFG